jgi:two-component system nitrate/nitrite response regulator NarL
MSTTAVSPSVLLIDDHALFRTGLRLLLADHWPKAVLHEAVTVEGALAAEGLRPDLILLDMTLPGMHGLSGLPMLRHHFGAVPIVVVSAQDDERLVQEAMERGACGFLSKTVPPDRLVEALKSIAQGAPVWVRSCTTEACEQCVDVDLDDGTWRPSPMQRRILSLLGSYRSNKALAKALSLSENQARAEVSVLMERLGVISRQAAHQVAKQQGWTDEAQGAPLGGVSAS